MTRHDGLDADAGTDISTGEKNRSLLGDFPSRTNKLVLKIPNRPRCCTPLDSLQRPSARAKHRQERETNETKCQTNKSKQSNGIRSITLRESKGSGQRYVCPHQLLEEQEKTRMVIAEAEQAKKELARIKAETKTEELKLSTLVACLSKNSATKTATSVLNGVNSLFGGNKVNRLEKENA